MTLENFETVSANDAEINSTKDASGSESTQIITTQVEPNLSPLTQADAARLGELETTIQRGLESFLDVGHAFKEIQSSRLYRGCYKTFQEYCRSKWGIGRQYAYRQIAAAELVDEMSQIDDMVLPKSESAIRPLTALETTKDKVAALRSASAKSNGEPPTAIQVQQAVEEIKGSGAGSLPSIRRSRRVAPCGAVQPDLWAGQIGLFLRLARRVESNLDFRTANAECISAIGELLALLELNRMAGNQN